MDIGTDTLFLFSVGQYVLRRGRSIGKLAPKMDGPYRVLGVTGRLFQRVTMVGSSGRPTTCHASKLVLYNEPVDESEWTPPRPAAGGERLAAEVEEGTKNHPKKRRLRSGPPS